MRQEEKKKKDKDPQEEEDAPSSSPSEEEGVGLKASFFNPVSLSLLPTNNNLNYYLK